LILLQQEAGDDWQAQYRFRLQPFAYNDYDEMCRYHQTSPESHFTQGRICTLATPQGRVTLSEMRLITTSEKGERHERVLLSEAEYAATLREHFGIVMIN
jgi:N-hydroxyarylamine O-acetyltransferase